ncbi:16S rRNA (guanine(527)-N(7))-methyltransferase RsmG [Pontibaca methylaminivorans]|uniref:Ribosomal RNA small subunit methyltransferase G n=1 Tax=Pontibaca methylaminivorans TaxID=515897 RepID=A0A1R3WS70_9RHOB|nr:16S rRNA (guanine(527)-N(7))-methyltransferase RsmG [Pontibaca methylaminivorans]SIT80865.1 16S rRNA (guanine527-N7)-methyltransferase [Pontibaca methylaminivorans]
MTIAENETLPDVSRETSERLESFERLIRRWNPRINLISASSMDVLRERHIRDSIQVFRCAQPSGLWVDIGTGGGFPGLICAILAVEEAPDLRFVLVESDKRKASFLRVATQELGLNCEILAERAEAVASLGADILSARALAPLLQLLGLAGRHLAPEGTGLFPKGKSWRDEIAEARRTQTFQYEAIPSVTDQDAVILKIDGASIG